MLNYPAAYQSTKGSALDVDKDFYRRIATEQDSRELVESIVIPIRSGRAWTVPAGHVFRIVTIEGPQVADLNLWNLHNPRERMWASRTRQLQAAHVSTFDRLWSTLPFLPLIRQPTLFVNGDDDPLARLSNARWMVRLMPHARLHVLEGAGHHLLFEQPAELGALVRAFVGDNEAR